MTLARRVTRDDVCLGLCCGGHRYGASKGLCDKFEPDVEFGYDGDIVDEEVVMIGGRGSQVGTCMDIDFSGLFSHERRRSRLGLLGYHIRNVGKELVEKTAVLWRRIKRKRPRGPKEWCWFLVVNAAVVALTFLTGIITYESSVNILRHSLETTVLFPIYLPHAVALSIACKLQWQALVGILLGLYCSRMYAAARGMYLISTTRGGVLAAVAILGTAEVYSANYLLHRHLVKEGSGKKLPTIESIKEALKYLAIVVICTLLFDTIIALVICTSPLVLWSDFYRFWGTSWLGVLSGMLTISPTTTHMCVWQLKPSLLRPRKLVEALLLTVTTGTLVIIIFVTNLKTVIYPLPYLLFPIIILTAFRFNRLGCSLVVLIISYVCAWASVRGKGALYRMAGSPRPVSSPKLILQVELFVSVLGLVGILLAAAVREKKQLARDLHKMNEELESTVTERTIELVKANEALKESQRKAELANQAKSDFLANMSHEIRTPIHGIMGLTSLVMDSELTADQRESLISVQDCANVLLHIINSILDLAKIEAGRIEVEFVTFKVSYLVSTTVRMLQTRAKAKNLDLVWDIDPSVPNWLVGDSGKLQQCLLNLIGNAVKFTHQGSVRVHVRVDKGWSGKLQSSRRSGLSEDQNKNAGGGSSSPSVHGLIRNSSFSTPVFSTPAEWQCCALDLSGSTGGKSPSVSIRNKEENTSCVPVVFEVHDSGIGVSPEKLQDIFTPFTQADASTSRVYGGTGLGLCIVQRFVELLGGKLEAKSELGKGSCFSFCVPLGYSPSNQEGTSGEMRDSMNLRSLLSSAIPVEAESSGVRSLVPVNSWTDIRDNSPASPSRHAEHLRSSSDPKEYMHFPLDSFNNRNAFPLNDTISPAHPDMSWKMRPRRSIENLDVLLANWQQNHSRSKERVCECTCTHLDSGHKCCNPLCRPTVAPKQLDSPQQAASSLQFETIPGSPRVQQCGSIQLGRYSPSTLNAPLDGKSSVLQTHSNLRQDGCCSYIEAGQPSRSQTESRRVPSSSSLRSNRSEKDDALQKEEEIKLHVLLAEDNLVNQKVASRQLQKHKHAVTVVGDGLQALETVKEKHDNFDLVLMDVQMPNMDGLEATQRIREHEAEQGWKKLPILGLTAHAIQGYEDTCLKSGMDGYLGKPFDIDQLLRVIDKYVPPKDAIILRR